MARRCLVIVFALCAWPAAALASADQPGAVTLTHRMMLLAIQLGVILFAARLGNILFERLHLPGALGELAVGMVIGPYCLGQIPFYGFAGGLFPPHGAWWVSPELYGLAAVAAIVLLFTVGLETDLRLLLRYALAGGLVGLGGIALSFLFGAAAAMVFSEAVFGRPLGLFAPPCLFLGLIATATSVGITARILSEKRKLDSPEGVTILSAAVIDDVGGIILLAVVMGVVTASRATGRIDWGHTGVIAAKAVGVWLAATVVGLVAARRISFLLKWFGERTSIAVMALGLALVLAGLFEEAGLAMIIGAYVMGLSLSKADISRVVREKLQPVYALLVPVFFCVMGMRINFAQLAGPAVLGLGLVYALAALAAKVVGCGLPALLANFNLRGAMRVGFGMAPRCEVALIIAGIGASAGLVSPAMFAAVLIMVLVNTVVAPLGLTFLFRTDAAGTRRRVSEDRKARSEVSFELPSLELAEFMVEKLAGVFESEGFFVHLLGREPRLYQLRKDRAVIEVTCAATRLTFHCGEGDVPLVNTAMYEAVAALEQAAKELRKPLDTAQITMRLQQASQFQPGGLNLRHCLTPALIEPALRGSTKGQIIDELLDILGRQGLLKDRRRARDAVWTREESMSTGLQHGVAIPHGKTDAVDRLVCAIGIKQEGADFDSMDGQPARIFILTLSPKDRPAPHVQFMSTIGQILNEEGRRRILACGSAQEIYDAIVAPPRAEERIRRRRRARRAAAGAKPEFDLADYLRPDCMQPRLAGTTKEEILRELVVVLDQRGLVRDAAAAYEAVMARERQMSTALADGVAVPHGRTDAVDNLVCAVGVKRDGIDFGAADGRASRIFLLVLTPTEGADPYLQFVASAIGVLDPAGRRQVLLAQTPEDLYEVFVQDPGR